MLFLISETSIFNMFKLLCLYFFSLRIIFDFTSLGQLSAVNKCSMIVRHINYVRWASPKPPVHRIAEKVYYVTSRLGRSINTVDPVCEVRGTDKNQLAKRVWSRQSFAKETRTACILLSGKRAYCRCNSCRATFFANFNYVNEVFDSKHERIANFLLKTGFFESEIFQQIIESSISVTIFRLKILLSSSEIN